MMKLEDIQKELQKKFPQTGFRLIQKSILVETPKDLFKVAVFLKESTSLSFDYLSSITGVDYLDYLESVYHFYSMTRKENSLILRVRVPKEDPKIPSLTPLYRGAELQEREAYDMLGILYENHPDLRRLLMWEGFEGFPLRKDYQQEDSEILETQDTEWLEKEGVSVPPQMKTYAETLKKEGKRALAKKPSPSKP